MIKRKFYMDVDKGCKKGMAEDVEEEETQEDIDFMSVGIWNIGNEWMPDTNEYEEYKWHENIFVHIS